MKTNFWYKTSSDSYATIYTATSELIKVVKHHFIEAWLIPVSPAERRLLCVILNLISNSAIGPTLTLITLRLPTTNQLL